MSDATIEAVETGFALASEVKRLGDRFYANQKYAEALVLYRAAKIILHSWKEADRE